jgi:copper chaperone CopZ
MTKRQFVGLAVMILILAFSTMAVSAAIRTVTIRIEGMTSEKSAASVEEKLKATEGVEDARVSFGSKKAWIKYDDQKTSVPKLREVINGTGFKASD